MEQVEYLARRVIQGQTGALEEFAEAFRGKVFQYSYLNCGRREEAEEVAQETLLKVCEHLHEVREPEHVKTWVYRIAHNICLTRRRKARAEGGGELSLEEIPGHWEDLLPSRGELPEAAAYHQELRKVLAVAIHELSDKYRGVVILRDVEGLTVEETARILQVSESLVKTRLHRARGMLRKRLESQHISVTY